jgi:8-oxo-dGTP diphosphatase
VTCDAVIFTMRADDLVLLLIQRKEDPFKGRWALPGGFVNENESLDRAAARELYEETGLSLSASKLEQLGAFGDPGRDPRGHTITIAWLTFLVTEPKISAGDDAVAAEWHSFRSLDLSLEGDELPPASSSVPPPPIKKRKKAKAGKVRLAFDHAKIISKAYGRLCHHLDDPLRDRAFDLMPSRFTLAELRHFYELVSGREIAQRAFNKRLLDYNLVTPATSKPTKKAAEQLYRWHTRDER